MSRRSTLPNYLHEPVTGGEVKPVKGYVFLIRLIQGSAATPDRGSRKTNIECIVSLSTSSVPSNSNR